MLLRTLEQVSLQLTLDNLGRLWCQSGVLVDAHENGLSGLDDDDTVGL